MNGLIDFLNQPIVITLITLVGGSYLLSLVADRRSRQEKRREKSIEFITEAGNHIGEFVVTIYKQLRTGTTEIDQSIEDGFRILFSKRISIQVGSQAYLQSDDFYRKYFRLLDELAAVVMAMTELGKSGRDKDVVREISNRSASLRDSWSLKNESLNPHTGEAIDELILYMDIILHRVTDLLTTNLKSVIG